MKKNTLFIVLIIGIALIIGIWRDNQDGAQTAEIFTTLPLNVGTPLPSPQKLPQFSLLDMHGNAFTPESLKNKWSFLFFGYSHCPNICPITLKAMQQVSLRCNYPSLQFVFITIDPERDTSTHLKEYLKQEHFDATILGVTGNIEIIKTLTKDIGVHIGLAEHSGAILLINPEGKLAAIFTSVDKPHAIARDFQNIVHHYMKTV